MCTHCMFSSLSPSSSPGLCLDYILHISLVYNQCEALHLCTGIEHDTPQNGLGYLVLTGEAIVLANREAFEWELTYEAQTVLDTCIHALTITIRQIDRW